LIDRCDQRSGVAKQRKTPVKESCTRQKHMAAAGRGRGLEVACTRAEVTMTTTPPAAHTEAAFILFL